LLFKEMPTKQPAKRKYNKKPKNSMSINNDQPSKRTRSSGRISNLAAEFLEYESDVNN
jgi:hypothetical protein